MSEDVQQVIEQLLKLAEYASVEENYDDEPDGGPLARLHRQAADLLAQQAHCDKCGLSWTGNNVDCPACAAQAAALGVSHLGVESRALAARVKELEKECRIRDLATPLEEDLSNRIDEMCRYLAMEDGFTLNGIARLFIETQKRMAADWLEIGRLRRLTKDADSLATLRARIGGKIAEWQSSHVVEESESEWARGFARALRGVVDDLAALLASSGVPGEKVEHE